MIPKTNSPTIEEVDRWFSEGALSVVNLDRDETDSYLLTIKNLSSPHRDEATVPERATALEWLPAGSRWTHVLGWHSYFGIPFPPKRPSWIAVGAESIVEHPSRGAYPVFRAYVYSFSSSEKLIANLNNFSDTLPHPIQRVSGINATNGLIRSNSSNPAEHTWIEAWIIRQAIVNYRKDVPLLFRTLVLAENILTNLNYPHPRRGNEPPDCLMATVPSIEKTFSSKLTREITLFVQAHKTPG